MIPTRSRKIVINNEQSQPYSGDTWELKNFFVNEPSFKGKVEEEEGNERGWFQFCVETSHKYERARDPISAMIYWSMRYWDGSQMITDAADDPWWKDTCEYWNYKIDWLISGK